MTIHYQVMGIQYYTIYSSFFNSCCAYSVIYSNFTSANKTTTLNFFFEIYTGNRFCIVFQFKTQAMGSR